MGALMNQSSLLRYIENTPTAELNSVTLAYLASFDHLLQNNSFLAKEMIAELQKQRSHLKLIASENYTSYAVQMAMANWLTDK